MTIDLDADVLNQLEHKAQAAGVPVDAYVKSLLTNSASFASSLVRPRRTLSTPAERAAAFRQWALGHERGVALSSEAMERSSYYGDRG